jgi:hypothetical protein
MKIFVIENPFAFIGYILVLAGSIEEAKNKVIYNILPTYGKINMDWFILNESNLTCKELEFDNNGIYDKFMVLE